MKLLQHGRSEEVEDPRSTMPTLEGDRSMLTTAPPITVTGMALQFRRDLPGFKGARNFVVRPLGEKGQGIFAHLCCTDTVYVQGTTPVDNLTLLVTSPGILWSGYEVRIDDAMVDELELSNAEDAGLLAIVHPRTPLSTSTANLYSPIVVNRRTGFADQLVPAATEQEVGWSMRTPLPPDGGVGHSTARQRGDAC
jgi:flagellar assembly factor FliW